MLLRHSWSAGYNILSRCWFVISEILHNLMSNRSPFTDSALLQTEVHSLWLSIASEVHSLWLSIASEVHSLWLNIASEVHSLWLSIALNSGQLTVTQYCFKQRSTHCDSVLLQTAVNSLWLSIALNSGPLTVTQYCFKQRSTHCDSVLLQTAVNSLWLSIAISEKSFVTQRQILAGAKNLLCFIQRCIRLCYIWIWLYYICLKDVHQFRRYCRHKHWLKV